MPYSWGADSSKVRRKGKRNICSDGQRKTVSYKKKKYNNEKCEICGWDKAYCDRHRINPQKGYVKGNIKILCPNCHRLEGLNPKSKSK